MVKLKYSLIFILLGLILVVAWSLRYRHYDVIPLPGESQDEYSNSWVGLSLIRLGVPVSHTGLAGYQDTDYRYINVDHIYQSTARGLSLSINRPWLDHPPLLGLITGSWSYLRGARVFSDTTAHLVRQPLLIFSLITISLTFWLGAMLFGATTGLLAALLLAVSPIVTVSSRMVQAENGFIISWLLGLIFILYYLRSPRPWLLYLAAMAAAISVWFKLPGIVAVISITIILYQSRHRLAWFTWLHFLLISTLGAASVIFYGLSFGSTFTSVQLANASRTYGLGFDILYKLFTATKITSDKFLTDGLVPAAWLAVFALIHRLPLQRQLQPILIPIFSYLCLYLYLGSGDYGWYHIPFFPFLFLTLARYLTYSWTHVRSVFTSFLFLLLPVGISLGKIYGSVSQSGLLSLWKVIIILLSAAFVLCFCFQKRPVWLLRGILVAIFSLAAYLSLKYNLMLTPDYWYHAT